MSWEFWENAFLSDTGSEVTVDRLDELKSRYRESYPLDYDAILEAADKIQKDFP